MRRGYASLGVVSLVTAVLVSVAAASGLGLQAKNEALLQQMASTFGYTPEQMTRIRAIFQASGRMGQGNPAVTQHPLSSEQCRARLEREAAARRAAKTAAGDSD